MKLLYTLGWLELRRLRVHMIFLLLIFVVFALWLGIDFTDFENVNYDIQTESEGSGEISQYLKILSVEGLISLLSICLPLLGALGAGSLVAMIVPFRSPQEWQEGQFQMLKMCSWNLYQIQWGRFAVYLAGVAAFFALTIISASIALASNSHIEIPYIVQDVVVISFFLVLSTVPLAISIGMVIDATRTAYYLRGIHFLVTFIQFAGWVALMNISQKSIRGLNASFIPPIPIKSVSLIPDASYNGPTHLYWEPVLISFVLAVAFVSLSARIQEEAEA